MKPSFVASLLIASWLVGCDLSPGQDLPSAGSKDSGDNHSPLPNLPDSPGGDGDIAIDRPPDSGAPCGLGGAGGHGGACPASSDRKER